MSRAGQRLLEPQIAECAARPRLGALLPTALHIAPVLEPEASPTTLLQTKLGPPTLGSHLVQRSELLEMVKASDAAVVAVCAPAGYGKTTFLTQLAAASGTPTVWLTLDETDDDPARLVTELATVLERTLGIDSPLLGSPRSLRGERLFTHALPCLVNSLGGGPGCVVILDDVQRIKAQPGQDVLGYLCEHLPGGVRLVVAGRQLAGLPTGRLRARRMLLELGPEALSLSRDQAAQVFDELGLHLAPEALDASYAQTEGWPAGTYLAGLAASEAANPDAAASAFDGADASIVDFLTTEQLDPEAEDRRVFLERTAVLDQFSAPLCDAVLDRDDSAAVLAAMEQSNGFLISLDRRRQWYRYHRLFRQALRAELERRAPEQVRQIHQRASSWYEEQADSGRAIEHAVRARDERRVANLLTTHLQELSAETPLPTLCEWLEALSDSSCR
jgi:LuxR family maltose regulon positive regulatory protein